MASSIRSIRFAVAAALLLACAGFAWGADIPPAAARRLQAGEFVDLIIEYEAAAVEADAAARRSRLPRRSDDAGILAMRADRYKTLRSTVDAAVPPAMVAALKDYTYLPMSFRRFRSIEAARAYAAHPGVKAVFENEVFYPVLAQSLPLVGEPAVAAAGLTGSGTTVAVIDTGINYTRPEFGGCTAPGVPAGCRVVVSLDFGTGSSDTSHGTNVAAVVASTAPGTRIAMLNAFSGTIAYTADILEAINWAIANQAAYNIVAINMSLGDGLKYTAPCSATSYTTPVANARNAGITVVVASGNEAYTNGIAKPACTPGAVSVGAVYDANIGGVTWGSNLCTDAATAADKVTCFSNSASFLTMLAPGAMIAAGGYSFGGTSQAAPHVAGAVAVLRAGFPGETLDQTAARLTGKGVPIADVRNGIVLPRLNLPEAARPANDAFANAVALTGAAGSASGKTLLATLESGEPQHAGNAGGGSVWWRWTAPTAGQVTLDTSGSGFDTLLAVYIGQSVGALQPVAANDNDAPDGTSRLLFQAQAGTEYRIAVDGVDGQTGTISANWSLNASAQSNLSLNLSGTVTSPDASSHVLTLNNAGPQTATGVVATITLPSGATYLSGSPGCQAAGTLVNCTVGTLASGAGTSLSLQLGWSTGGASVSLSASVSSDTPDPVAANNTQVIEIAFGGPGDGDVPTLPEWGTLLLAMLLGGTALRREAKPGM